METNRYELDIVGLKRQMIPLCALFVLAEGRRDSLEDGLTGMDIKRRVEGILEKETGRITFNISLLYPLLEHFVKSGWITRNDRSGYSITQEGVKKLQAWLKVCDNFIGDLLKDAKTVLKDGDSL